MKAVVNIGRKATMESASRGTLTANSYVVPRSGENSRKPDWRT
jgi:hypothetical protein